MSRSTKRRIDDFDPNKSDPDDEDYSNVNPRPPKRHKHKSKGERKSIKRRRQRSYDEDSIEDDEDEISEDSFASGSGSEEEEEPKINPDTGRRMRSAAQKQINYEESSDNEDDIEDSEQERREKTSKQSLKEKATPQQRQQSLIVKLAVPGGKMQLRDRNAGKAPKRGHTPEYTGTRRSSRLSHDADEPTLIALTDSGRHAQVVKEGTLSPEVEVQRRRPSRGGKGPKKLPSAIMEASQEGSGQSAGALGAEEAVEDDKSEVAAEIAYSQGGSETQADQPADAQMGEAEGIIVESEHEGEAADDSDEEPVIRGGRVNRSRTSMNPPPAVEQPKRRKAGVEESSDFEPGADEDNQDEDMSESDAPKRKGSQRDSADESARGRKSRRFTQKGRSSRDSDASDDQDSGIDRDELAEEAEELAEDRMRNRRSSRRTRRTEEIRYDSQPKLRNRSNKPDYRVFRPELVNTLDEEDAVPAATPSRKGRGATAAYRSLFSIQGPFGGAVGGPPVFGAAVGAELAGGADSDSSDDEIQQKVPKGIPGIGGAIGMTPTTAVAPMFPQTHNTEPQHGTSGGPANLGKVKDKKALADSDPLGVDPNVNFDGVGGLENHINQLKEMVALPLLYPEVFQRFHVTPPRGVLFHGPPGTGKTLLARALASSVSSHGKKVTFYMRKGADALSKWVGEAERQLRLLFEEARKNQPSIIFFDEIDGLAPVRSSKQEQIHASIVATLLALMDGMDGRGQVIVIGATNRPDSVDPALRRPGRFDREFYFPLPDVKGRRAIIDIHTKGWDPPLQPSFKNQLAELTKGYGGADLRALCTEAALNAVQGTYPQIYSSDKKLLIDPSTIKVLAKDFMISVNKMIPSSERSNTSGASPLGKSIEPLLRSTFAAIAKILDEVIPQNKKLTALEEAQFDDRDDEKGFERETMQREFERARVFRPRLLIKGLQGMGQQYLGAALLNKFETLHVQSFDLATILEDSTRSPEATVVQLFKEVRRHKPSVIYIPNVDVWYQTVGSAVIKTFTTLLKGLPPNDPILVLGILELSDAKDTADPSMLRDLFGFSLKNQYMIERPKEAARREYFESVIEYIRKPPSEFPDPENRRKRQLPQLEPAPEPKAPEGPSKEQLKAQKKHDRHVLNILKINLQPVMDQIKLKYKKFRTPIIDEREIQYLFDEQDPSTLSTDLDEDQRQAMQLRQPFRLQNNDKGEPGLLEGASGKFYYNLDIVMIEKRLSNGYYKRPKDFLGDIKRLAKDARTSGDPERTLKANEMLANVEVDMQMIETNQPSLMQECETVYVREQMREKEAEDKVRKTAALTGEEMGEIEANVPQEGSGPTTETSGPIKLGEQIPGPQTIPPTTPVRQVQGRTSELSNGYSAAHTGGGSNHHESNGSLEPAAGDGDTLMTDSQDVQHAQQTFDLSTAPNTQTQRSQKSAHTQIPNDFHPRDYHNSASTTTSGQKTSDRSNRSYNTQSTNGTHPGHHPDFSSMMPMSGGSQLPDTQDLPQASPQNSQPSQSSQQFALPPPRAATITSILNSESHPSLLLDEHKLLELHTKCVEKTSGLSVEQLEQVSASLMDAIWKSRGQWNRNIVLHNTSDAFNEIIKDIEEYQATLPPSQEDE